METELAIAPTETVMCRDCIGRHLAFEYLHRRTPSGHTDSRKGSFPAWTPDGKRITFHRGPDTFAIDPDDPDTKSEELFRKNATSLSWSATSRTAFVRDRALVDRQIHQRSDEKKLLKPMPLRISPSSSRRFSPDSLADRVHQGSA